MTYLRHFPTNHEYKKPNTGTASYTSQVCLISAATAGRRNRLSGGERGAGGLEVQAAALPGRKQAGKAAAGDLGRCALAGPNNLGGASRVGGAENY